ncbi:TrbC family F-type conjugative pilus assembly protein [Pseudomonas aeruginosa]|uniref:TrbC family F-type conjugative pilus assembly protein n=1 Tax=Pseudomonas aeruginosa TaxID=287 RepID=UPI001E4F5259|nr:TrbC family F-type conjugative pilus assembly protein [Pseudomonas aeruginosa]MCC9289592.1 conjugal transfer protein [Pseudomonas aeruginosa]UVN18840.1 F-type type IV secretion, pilus extension and retraction protein [Pseudomonas aeruginosa]
MVKEQLAMCIGLAFSCTMGIAGDDLGIRKYDINEFDAALLDQVREFSRNAEAAREEISGRDDMSCVSEMAEKANVQGSDEEAQQNDSRLASADGSDREEKHPLGDGNRTLIFVSWSMRATALKDILLSIDGLPGDGIVLRGIPDGMSMRDAVTKMHLLTRETQSTVSVLLDPLAFQRHSDSAVPTVALEAPNDAWIAKAAGTSSVSYIEAAVKDGKRADLGTIGSTQVIIEPDLIEVANQRIAELDTDAMKMRAIARLWDNHKGHPLPPVTESATRLVDASVIVPNDILDSQGRDVQKAGRIYPLDMMPFDQKLVVIDPTHPWQDALAKREYADHRANLTVTVMATQIPTASGCDLFKSVQDSLDAPWYLLPPEMAERFQIFRAPSVATADTKNFIVREVARTAFEEANHEHQ